MNIYLHAAGNPEYAEKLLEVLANIPDQAQILLLPTELSASAFVDLDIHSGDVLILIPGDGQQLRDLQDMKDLLQDFRLIVILPDDDIITITRGHLLMPRFLTFVDNDMVEVCHVLSRMIGQ